MPSHPTKFSNALERITLQMTSSLNLQEVLTSITQGLVDEMNAAFARIWLLDAGDICAECLRADICPNRQQCLHLKASAGIYTNLNGDYRRVPLGAMKIGRIARGEGPMYTNDVLNDERLTNKKWLRETRLRAFAGHPLIFNNELLGVIAMFSRQSIAAEVFDQLPVFASQAAIAIKNARLFDEVKRLNERLKAENVYLQEEIKLEHNFEEIISQSETMKRIFLKIEQVASTDATVLVLGETGSGKELIARAVHYLSQRKDHPLVKVNCAALPASLIESELFGHEKGAFTGALTQKIGRFELADCGTIFLDEIGDLPLELQAKLLRILQEGEFERLGNAQTTKVDVRIIAATNRDLEQAIKEGGFREDLYYRLNVFPVRIPPLRDRKEDIPLLVRYFAGKYAAKLGKQIDRIPQKVLNALQNYYWPGNVRELENIMERAVILSPKRTLNIDNSFYKQGRNKAENVAANTLADIERNHILKTLEACNWRIDSKDGAAEQLGLPPSTLRGRMEKLGIKKLKRAK